MGLGRLERPTSPLSGVRSNHLSYRPERRARPTRPIVRAQKTRPTRPKAAIPLVRMMRKRNEGGTVPPMRPMTGSLYPNDPR